MSIIFQLKLISEMFTCENLPRRLLHTIFRITYSRISQGNLLWEFALVICRENMSQNLPWEFAVEICRRNLQWLFAVRFWRRKLTWKFAVATCRGFLYLWAKLFFVYVNFFYMGAKLFYLWDFLYWQCFF